MHCSSANWFQNDQEKFLNDCYKEIIASENAQNQLWLCRKFSPSGFCVSVESCWPQGSSTWIHVRLICLLLVPALCQEYLESSPCLHTWVFSMETWVRMKGLAGQDFMVTWGATNKSFFWCSRCSQEADWVRNCSSQFCASKVALGPWILEWNRSIHGSNPNSWPELGSVGQRLVPVTPGHSSDPHVGHSLGSWTPCGSLPPQMFCEIIHGFVSGRITSPPSWLQELGSPWDKTKPFQGMMVALKQKSTTPWCFAKLEHMHLIVIKVDLTFCFLKLSCLGRKKKWISICLCKTQMSKMCELPIFRYCIVIVFLPSVPLISLFNLSALHLA